MRRLPVAIPRHARFVLPVLVVAALAASAEAATNSAHLARLLAKKDPGARVGGNTIVATGKGEHIYAVPGRPNFVVALGDGETIHGAAAGDELGALGKHVKIIAPKAGHALIEGGPQSTIVVGGKGHDLVVERKPGATIKVMSPDDEIVAKGPHDRVVCGPHVHDETIIVGKTDTVSASCRGHHDTIKHAPVSHSSRTRAHAVLARDFAPPVARTAAVSGNGSNSNPFTAPCDIDGIVCTVSSFGSRPLSGYWAGEYVPAYKCPSERPYLVDRSYAPFGTKLSNGVEVQGLGPVGVSISATSPEPTSLTIGLATGTLTGYPNSSATNWTTGTASYKVILHCTSDTSLAYYSE